MKKILFTSLFAVLLTSIIIAGNNNTTIATDIAKNSLSNIDFKIENNTGAEFKYCVNGGHNYINKGATKSFSYSVGQEFKYIDGSNCGKTWFKVKSDMAGKTFKVGDLK